MTLEGSGDILASRRNTPASRLFFILLFLWTRVHARAGRCSPPPCNPPLPPFIPSYARRSSGGERGAGSRREQEDEDDDGGDSAESSGSSGRAGCNIRRLPHRGGRRIIQNYLVFSLSSSTAPSSSSFFLLSAQSPALLETPSKRGEDLKTNKQPPPRRL